MSQPMSRIFKNAEIEFRKFFPKRTPDYKLYQKKLQLQKGLEIGGPSFAFSAKGFLPLYPVIQSLDGCNFSTDTVWEGKLEAGKTYRYDNRIGHQYIADAADLSGLPANSYDFILSCHSLEHLANPLRAVEIWLTLLKADGYLILIVPHKDNTFDHNRKLTSLSHLLEDYQQKTTEHDNTHFDEVIKFHDLGRDAGVETVEELKTRTFKNIYNRCVHHHVFNTPLIAQLTDHLGLQILNLQTFSPFHIIGLFKKSRNNKIDNTAFLNKENPLYHKTKFPSDLIWNK
jgi:SAM-dependent methyltransferase